MSARPSGRWARISALPALVLLASLSACGPTGTPDTARQGSTADPDDSLVELGRAIFFDKRLSDPPGQSCASCHDPRWAFSTPREKMEAGMTPGAYPGRFGMRNVPTLMYAAFSPAPVMDHARGSLIGGLMHDQRAASLEDQALRPFFDPAEMSNASPEALLSRLRGAPYAGGFDRVFGRRALADPDTALQRVAQAIAAYQRSAEFAPFSAKYDAVLAGQATFTPEEARGFDVFRDAARGNCTACHSLGDDEGRRALFTDFSSHNLGLPANRDSPWYRMPVALNPDGPDFIDRGVAIDPARTGMEGRFRVPTLRNVAVTSPYMHNGVFASLGEALLFYATGCQPGNPQGWAPPEVPQGRNCSQVGQLNLSGRDIADLVAFMYALTDGWYDPLTGEAGPMQVPPATPIIGTIRREAAAPASPAANN